MLKTFYKIMAAFSEQDVLSGPYWYEKYLDLKESRPFSDNFDYMGTGDMNILNNTGSLFLVIALTIILACVSFCFVKLFARCYK